MNVLQQIFQMYLGTFTTFFNVSVLEDVFLMQFLQTFCFLTFFFMIVFIVFVPVYYSIYLIVQTIIYKMTKGGSL